MTIGLNFVEKEALSNFGNLDHWVGIFVTHMLHNGGILYTCNNLALTRCPPKSNHISKISLFMENSFFQQIKILAINTSYLSLIKV